MITTHCTPPDLALAAAHRTLARPQATDAELLTACATIRASHLSDTRAKERAEALQVLIEGEAQ